MYINYLFKPGFELHLVQEAHESSQESHESSQSTPDQGARAALDRPRRDRARLRGGAPDEVLGKYKIVQSGASGERLGWVELDLGCSTILLGQ